MSIIIYQANLKHGEDTSGAFIYGSQAAMLSAAATDLAGCNECSVGDLGSWDGGFTAGGMTRALYHPTHSSAGDGNCLWYRSSTVTLHQTLTKELNTGINPHNGLDGIGWDGSQIVRRSAIAHRVTIGGLEFWAVLTHLCHSQGRNAPTGTLLSDQRERQIADLLTWIDSLTSLPVALFGDMNFHPDDPKSGGGTQRDLFTAAGYADLWVTGIAQAKATANWDDRGGEGTPVMPITDLGTRTLNERRLDQMYVRGAGWSLNNIDVPDTRATCGSALVPNGTYKKCPDVDSPIVFLPEDQGIRPSDHNWIRTTLDIGSSGPVVCQWHTSPTCQ